MPQGRPVVRHGKLAGQLDFLEKIIAQDADITLAEMASALEDANGIKVSLVAIHKRLKRAGYTYKKGLIAQECHRAGIKTARDEWIIRRQSFMRNHAYRLVFLNETSVKTNLTRLRGRSKRGERLYGSVGQYLLANGRARH